MNNENIEMSQDALDDLTGRYLTFYIGDSFYGIELIDILEIIGIQQITPVPGLPYYFKGLINLRGKVVPVIDVRLKFGREERTYDDKTCIIVVTIQGMQVGLVVDSVAEVVTIENSQKNEPPLLGKNGERYLSSIAKVNNRVILNIDCDKFFQSDLRPY